MKTNHVLLIAAIAVLSSCGTTAKYASSGNGQRFRDGIYESSPAFMTKEEKADMQTGTEALVAKTKASEIYLFGDRKDTVMIPQNMSATIRYDKENGGTSVTVAENYYDWRNNIDPWSVYSSWDYSWRYSYGPWGRPGYWGRYYDPWYYTGWYSGYWGWYGPWNGYGWYDPWYSYSGWWGWHDPYYWGWHHPHYCGWYGGWGPHYPGGVVVINENRWHGSRSMTGSDRVFTSRVSTRGGIGNSSRSGRGTAVQSNRTGSGTSMASSARLSPVQSRSISRAAITQPARQSASGSAGTVRGGSISRTGAQQSRPAQAGPAANYRRPASSGSGRVSTASGSGYSRPAGSGYERSSSSSSGSQNYERRSSSNYNSSSSSVSRSSSGFSSGSSSVSRSSSSSGGGGYSRSSGGSGGGRR